MAGNAGQIDAFVIPWLLALPNFIFFAFFFSGSGQVSELAGVVLGLDVSAFRVLRSGLGVGTVVFPFPKTARYFRSRRLSQAISLKVCGIFNACQ